MSLQLLNIKQQDKEILNKIRQLPMKSKKIIQKQIDELIEKLEDESDLKAARLAMNEKSIPYEDAIKKIGLR